MVFRIDRLDVILYRHLLGITLEFIHDETGT